MGQSVLDAALLVLKHLRQWSYEELEWEVTGKEWAGRARVEARRRVGETSRKPMVSRSVRTTTVRPPSARWASTTWA